MRESIPEPKRGNKEEISIDGSAMREDSEDSGGSWFAKWTLGRERASEKGDCQAVGGENGERHRSRGFVGLRGTKRFVSSCGLAPTRRSPVWLVGCVSGDVTDIANCKNQLSNTAPSALTYTYRWLFIPSSGPSSMYFVLEAFFVPCPPLLRCYSMWP